MPTSHNAKLASWILAAAALVGVLVLHLLPALLAGLFVFEAVHLLAGLRFVRSRHATGQAIAVGVLAAAVIAVLALAIAGVIMLLHSDGANVPALLQRMADILDRWRTTLPPAIVDYLPADVDELKVVAVHWLRGHAGGLQHAGTEAGLVTVHLVVGAVIGALVALHETRTPQALGPLGRALETRVGKLGLAFRRVVFGQVRISAINAVLTGIYLIVALPIAGIHVPLAKTMVAVTFIVGLLPVIGNIISNTIVVILSLSVSPAAATSSLVFLVVIHKLEYFLNARIVGTQVHAHAWELLLAMLVMEAAFGLPGVAAAPIYYAYFKAELVDEGMV